MNTTPINEAANMQTLWEISGRPSTVKVRAIPLHPTSPPEPLPPYPAWMHEHNAIHGKLPPLRPDKSDNYNEWEDTQ